MKGLPDGSIAYYFIPWVIVKVKVAPSAGESDYYLIQNLENVVDDTKVIESGWSMSNERYVYDEHGLVAAIFR